MSVSLGIGLLIKSLIAIVIPGGAAFCYLLFTKQLFLRETWKRLRPLSAAAIVLLIPLPWYTLATLHNPPHFDFTLHSGPGQYRGFFWDYFINEQVLRFLNRRYPRDYNTVPRLQFWLFNLVWLFPASVYFPAAARLRFKPLDRAGRVRLLALCWSGFVMLFFTFSTTQEYYSMPIYPALALLLGCAVAEGGSWVSAGTRVAATLGAAGAALCAVVLATVWNLPTPGDIVSALTQHPEAYTLSLGHMQDLTLPAFAYFRAALLLAGIALLVGAIGGWVYADRRGVLALAVMMVLFTHAAAMALVVMEPYLSSRPLAEALNSSPPGEMIVGDEYYSFSSVFFYANRKGLLTNRVNNLEYGSNAPDAPQVFLDASELKSLWQSPKRHYLFVAGPALPRFKELLGPEHLHLVKASGGKFLFSNQPQ